MPKILLVPHPILRQKAKDLKDIEKKDIILAKEMMEVMIEASGVGLAANQIGILKKIITVNIKDENNHLNKQYILFNPKITSYSKKTNFMEEGCLSLPELFAEIERPECVTIEFINENKKLIKKKVDGIEARILQHEIDHLSGKLFVDYLSSLKRSKMIKKVIKMVKNRETE